MDRPASIIAKRICLTSELAFPLAGVIIDPAAHEARFGNVSEHIQPQPLKVLIALARQPGEVVTRDELVECCWDGRVVGDDVINRTILLLRGLGTRSGGFRIETVPKAGYRLIETDAKGSRRRWWKASIIVPIALLATAIFGAMWWSRMSKPSMPTVAVIAFRDEGDPITRGLSGATEDMLVHMLSDSSLPVRRFADKAPARRSADFLLSGDVRHDQTSAIVTLRIEDARQGDVLFSRVFRSPLGAAETLADQVGAYAAANLAWPGALMILDERRTDSPQLTTDLLKQSFLAVGDGDGLRAYEISAALARKQPDSAMAQIGLAHNAGLALGRLPRDERAAALRQGRIAERRARTLLPAYGDSYTASCLLFPSSRLAFCEEQLMQGLRVDPDAPYVSGYLRHLYGEVGRNREALRFARISLASNPYKPSKLGGLIEQLEAADQRSEAARVFDSAIRWWPDTGIFYRDRLDGIAQRGDLTAVAILAARSPAALFPADRSTVIRLAKAVQGRRRRDVRAICADVPGKKAMARLCLVALAQLGDIDGAFRLAKAIYPRRIGGGAAEEERIWIDDPDPPPTAYLASQALAPLRRDPRFIALASDVGLWRYWQSGRLPDFCRDQPEPICRSLISGT